MKELVTIVIPCYMQAQYLQEAIDSVLAQTYPHWECIIVNDASPDHTATVADAAAATDSRIRVIHKPQNEGLAAARNSGIACGNGEYILPLDADDALHPDYIQQSLGAFQQKSACVLVYTDVYHFGMEEKIVIREPFTLPQLCYQNYIHCTAMYRRSDYNKTEGYRINMKHGYEDWDFWLQLITDVSAVFKIPQPLFYIRVKENSMFQNLTESRNKEHAMRLQLIQNNRIFFEKWAPELVSQNKVSILSRIFRVVKVFTK